MSSILCRNKVLQFAKKINKSIHISTKYNNKKHNSTYPRLIFSGIQPTGTIHLGNYLGAIRQWISLQEANENLIISIVDMHAITVPQDVNLLREHIFNIMATLLACGIDPKKSIIFQQSAVLMHAQLAWIFGCMSTLPRLSQFPQFKEKSEEIKDVSLGTFAYPVLQTADILLYKATHVPVGEDQLPHLNFTQHIAQYFNNKYGNTFPIPEAVINESSARIKSLREPTKKMSKSSVYKKSYINLIDPPNVIRNNVMKAVTDFTSEITWEPEKRLGVSNLITIHSLLTDKTPEIICQEVNGLNTSQYKSLLADIIIEKLTPIREEYTRLINDPNYLINTLENGSINASLIAQKCLSEVSQKVGFSGGLLSKKSTQSISHMMS